MLGVIPQGTRLTDRSAGIPAWDSMNDRQKEVYALPCGEWSTAQKVADHYGVSRSKVYRMYQENNKDPIKANAAIEAYVGGE